LPKKPTKEGFLLFVLLKSPIASVSTVSRGLPSLVSLVRTREKESGGVERIFYI
jgi:hypothetical protein